MNAHIAVFITEDSLFNMNTKTLCITFTKGIKHIQMYKKHQTEKDQSSIMVCL